MTARGFGNTLPVASNDHVAGRQQNRRVELVVSGRSNRQSGRRHHGRIASCALPMSSCGWNILLRRTLNRKNRGGREGPNVVT